MIEKFHNLSQQIPLRLFVALAYTMLIFVILVQPQAQPVIPTGIPAGPPSWEREAFFSTLHLIGFGTLAALWWWVWEAVTPQYALAVAALIAITIGMVTEGLQSFVPDRGVQLIDIGANLMGVLLALALIRWWRDQH